MRLVNQEGWTDTKVAAPTIIVPASLNSLMLLIIPTKFEEIVKKLHGYFEPEKSGRITLRQCLVANRQVDAVYLAR